MIIAARLFAALGLLAAALVYSIIRLGFPDIGYESTLVLAGLSIWVFILSGITVVVLSILNYRRRRDKRWIWPIVASFAGLALLLVAIYFA